MIFFIFLKVSILILMDIALKESRVDTNHRNCRCFNPYSDGYCSERKLVLINFDVEKVVSILILMDIALKACRLC